MQNDVQDVSFKRFFIPLTTLKAILIIIALGILIFSNGLFNDFLADDGGEIVNNPVVQSIKNIPIFFSSSNFYNGTDQKLHGVYYRPLTSTIFSSIYTIFGQNYYAFHFFQMSFYIANAVLLFLLFKQFFKKSTAFLLSVTFLIHPINNEAAFFISATQETLFFFFGMLALFTMMQIKKNQFFIFVSLLLFISLLFKESGVLFIFISFVYLCVFKRKQILAFIGSLIPMIAIYLSLRINAVGFFISSLISPIHNVNLSIRLINIPEIFYFYIKTFIFPVDLAMSYQWVYTHIDVLHFFLPLAIDIVVILIFIYLAFVFKRVESFRKFFKTYVFFCIWFFWGVLLHFQIIPLDGTVADQWFYFPIIGILGIIGTLFDAFRINIVTKRNISIIIVVILLLSIRTFLRSFDWRDEFTLFSHDVKVSDAYNLEYGLSYELYAQGKFEDAKVYAEKSVKAYPHSNNYNVLGNIDQGLGDYQLAKDSFFKAINIEDNYVSYENLADLSMVYGDPYKNINFIKNTALEKYPRDSKLWLYLAVLEYTNSRTDESKIAISKAYDYDQSQLTSYFYDIIMNNKPLNLQIKK